MRSDQMLRTRNRTTQLRKRWSGATKKGNGAFLFCFQFSEPVRITRVESIYFRTEPLCVFRIADLLPAFIRPSCVEVFARTNCKPLLIGNTTSCNVSGSSSTQSQLPLWMAPCSYNGWWRPNKKILFRSDLTQSETFLRSFSFCHLMQQEQSFAKRKEGKCCWRKSYCSLSQKLLILKTTQKNLASKAKRFLLMRILSSKTALSLLFKN